MLKLAVFFVFFQAAIALFNDAAVIQLNSNNVRDSVLNSTYHWLVAFYAPWCPSSIKLASQYEAFAKENDWPDLHVAAFDADVGLATARVFNVREYPTVEYFAPFSSNVTKVMRLRRKAEFQQFASMLRHMAKK